MALIALAALGGSGHAQSEEAARPEVGQEPRPQQTVRVVAVGHAPFVIAPTTPGGEPSGLSLEVWRAVAMELGLPYELSTATHVSEALDQVAAGQADIAIGPISITPERAKRVAFSQPYFQASLGILAPPGGRLLDRIRPFFTAAVITAVSSILFILLVVGVLVWLAERKHNPEHFPQRPLAGIGNGIWMAIVTMTTVGYGDRVPRTTLGRVVTGVWMLLAALIFTSLIASLSSALTLSQLDAPAIATSEDLVDRRVAVVAGTTSQRFAQEIGARAVPAKTLDEAVALLHQEQVAAVVFDRPMLRYYVQQHPELDDRVVDETYNAQGYGFALPYTSELEVEIDVAILRLQTSSRLESITRRWLGR